MNKIPLVSVVTIFLDEEKFLREAIESVLAQTYENWELLLVDDGSVDSSTEIAARYASQWPGKIHYLEHQGHCNRGMSASRNLGIRHAQGAYVAFLDADDAWFPDKLDRQVAILERHSDAAMVCGASLFWRSWAQRSGNFDCDFIRKSGIKAACIYNPPELLLRLYPLGRGNSPCPSDLLVRRELLDLIGGFEEGFTGMYQSYEDQAFLAKVYLKARVFIADECLTRYRLHSASCCATIERAGLDGSVRQFYLNWLTTLLQEQKVTQPEVWNLLQKALRPFSYPKLYHCHPRHLLKSMKTRHAVGLARRILLRH